MNTWWARSSVCSSADQFARNLRESSGAALKWSRLEGRNGILMWKLEEPRQDEEMPSATARQEIPTVLLLAPPPQHDSHVHEFRGQGVHAKALRIRAFWSDIGRTPECPACETPGPGKSHTRVNAKRIKMPGKRVAKPRERRRRNGDSMRIQIHAH